MDEAAGGVIAAFELGMAVAQTVGTLLVGPMDRLLNTRKWVVVAAASLTLASLIVLAVAPVSPPVAVGLLLVLAGSSTYGSVLYAQVRGLFPDHLAGRSATITNNAQLQFNDASTANPTTRAACLPWASVRSAPTRPVTIDLSGLRGP